MNDSKTEKDNAVRRSIAMVLLAGLNIHSLQRMFAFVLREISNLYPGLKTCYLFSLIRSTGNSR